jgi:hypothetical protein
MRTQLYCGGFRASLFQIKNDIAMSNDRIPEIKTATAMFEVANTPECYPQDKEDILTATMNPKTLMQN